MAHFVPMDFTAPTGKPMFVPVAMADGHPNPCASVQVTDVPGLGKRVSLAVAVPRGALLACFTLDEVACLQDELDRAVAELTGFVQAGGPAGG